MPPRARKPWSRQQVQDVLDLLANTSKGLDQHAERILYFTAYIGPDLPTIKAFEEYMLHTSLLRQLLTTVSERCKRLDLGKEEVDVFKGLCDALGYCLAGRYALDVQGKHAFSQSLQQMLEDSGLLLAFVKTACMVVITLQQDQQEIQQIPPAFHQYSVSDGLKITYGLLQCFKFAVQALSPAHPDVLASATAIAMLTLTAGRAAAAAAATEDGSNSCKDIIQPVLRQVAATAHAMAAGPILQAVREKPRLVLKLLQDRDELLQLLLLNVATNASQLYHTQHGRTAVQLLDTPAASSNGSSNHSVKPAKKSKGSSSGATAGQQAQHHAPILHHQLYTSLHMSGVGEILGGHDPKDMQPGEGVSLATTALAAAATALQLLEHAPDIIISSSSSGSSNDAGLSVQWGLISKQRCHALLAAVQQLVVLNPDMAVADTATGLMLLACRLSTAEAEAEAQGYAREDWPLTLWTPEAAAELTQNMMQLLVPAVLHSLAASGPEVFGGSRSREKQEQATWDNMSRLLLAASVRATPALLVPILRRHLSKHSAALEAAVRTQAVPRSDQHKAPSSMPADQVLHAVHDLAYAVALSVGFSEGDIAVTAVAAAERGTHTAAAASGAARVAADAAATSSGLPTPADLAAAAPDLLGLLTSLQKLVWVTISHPAVREYFCMEVVSVTKQIRTAATNMVDRLQSSSSEGVVFDVVPWVALVARCAGVAADALAVAAGPRPDDEERMQDRPPVVDNLQVVLQAEADDITWLSQQLATLANSSSCSSRTPVPDAEALQVLEQQADDLDIQLRRCARGCLYSTSSISKATDLMAAARQYVDAGLMRDLAQLGAAVAAALPCKHFCNNPECLNCVRLSENELVGGKGSVCSGCKVARYCMKECQLAHWKQHKAACKQLQGQSSAGKKK